jgi:23S rRNA (adenine2503-C2)-methyltransferase
MKYDLKKLTRDDLVAALAAIGQPAWQADEIRKRLFQKGVREIAQLTSLPKDARQRLAEEYTIFNPAVVDRLQAADGTTKLLLRLDDGAEIETVVMPQGDRLTQCLSSQVGCPLGCAFCRTGQLGLRRNLLADEIIDQWHAARRDLPPGREITNLVFMGMGEPLLNREAVAEAIGFFTAPEGAALAAARITVSTAGIVPGIAWLAEALPRVKLAVSLNAPEDALRTSLMPVNRKHPLKDLVAALRRYPTGRHPVTIEYVLLGGVNDARGMAEKLARLLRGLKCRVNLIPFNPHSGLPYPAPTEKAVLAFQKELRAEGYTAIIRKSQGAEIGAACGQLGRPAGDARETTGEAGEV